MADTLSSDLVSNLGLGILAPASSVRGVEGNAGNTAGEGHGKRRHAHPGSESEAEAENENKNDPESAEHHLDRLA